MTIRGFGVLAALVLISALALGRAEPASAATGLFDNQNIASDTYYTLDTPAGTVEVTIEATVQNARISGDASEIFFVAMPGAKDIVVMRGPAEVAHEAAVGSIPLGSTLGSSEPVVLITATLDAPLKPGARAEFSVSYRLEGANTADSIIEAGLIETAFVSQGPGSFVYLDVPEEGETYVDPGCLLAANQPGDVADAGLQRWICGAGAQIALSSDNASVQQDCAAASDRCRQLAFTPHSAYAQSVTDLSKQGTLVADVVMPDGRTVTMTLLFFKRDQAWADDQFALAQRAFPRLEELFGFPYPHETILMRQSRHIESIGAAGIAFSDIGEVLLASGSGQDFDREVTVHELSHQWAGYQMDMPWLWEGQAEWATTILGPELGYSLYDRRWDSYGYTDLLGNWYNGSTISNSDYWYGKSEAFWISYEAAIGGRANMTAVLAQVDEYQQLWGLDGRWFLDRGEEVSGANLDELFLTWVFDRQTAGSLLADRREVRDGYNQLVLRASAFGFIGVPAEVRENLDLWQFAAAEGDLANANEILDRYQATLELATQAALPPTDRVAETWATGSLADVSSAIGDQRNAINAIIAATNNLSLKPDDERAIAQIEDAREAYARGDFAEAASLAATSVADSANADAAAVMIGRAKALERTFNPGFIETVGLFMKDPSGDLDAAEAALAEGDGTRALELSTGAYNDWDGAKAAGILRLSMLMAVNCILFALVWVGVKKFDSIRNRPAPVVRKPSRPGAAPPSPSEPPRPRYHDFENRP